MSGYPHNQPGYGYGGPPPPGKPYATAPPPAYGQPPAYGYGQPPTAQPYSAPSAPPYGGPDTKPHKENKPSYGGGSPSYGGGAPSYGGPDTKPPKENKPSYGGSPPYGGAPPYGGGQGYPPAGYGAASPFASLVPSTFPPGTDPNVVACFQMADQDGSGLIDDKELQRALSSYNQSFSLRTVHLLMYLFTDSSSRKIGPKEFTFLFYSLQSWREIFERFDRDRSGKIDVSELREALFSLGFSVSPALLDLLVSKFDKTGGED